MSYYIGQFLGLLTTGCCLLLPMLKRKRDMLWINAVNNTLAVGNILLISGWGSAIMVCSVAVVQSLVALVHLRRDTPVTKRENLLFLGLYLGCGLLSMQRPLDLLPTVAALFNMLATFQRDEQRTRWLLLVNASLFAVYYAIIGSTALLSVLCAMASAVMGIWRYRKKK